MYDTELFSQSLCQSGLSLLPLSQLFTSTVPIIPWLQAIIFMHSMMIVLTTTAAEHNQSMLFWIYNYRQKVTLAYLLKYQGEQLPGGKLLKYGSNTFPTDTRVWCMRKTWLPSLNILFNPHNYDIENGSNKSSNHIKVILSTKLLSIFLYTLSLFNHLVVGWSPSVPRTPVTKMWVECWTEDHIQEKSQA